MPTSGPKANARNTILTLRGRIRYLKHPNERSPNASLIDGFGLSGLLKVWLIFYFQLRGLHGVVVRQWTLCLD